MARSKSYQKKRKQSNKKFLLAICLVVAASVSYHMYTLKAMDKEITLLNNEISSNQKKMTDIESEITRIEEDFKIRNTDGFKEKIAEERLGMVKETEDDN